MHKATTADSFWAKVDKSGDCWKWTGAHNNMGYGVTGVNGRHIGAHRAAYEFTFGDIPAGLVIDHLCGERACCNPAHMEPVSQRENIRRGSSPVARQMRVINKRKQTQGAQSVG